MFVLIDMVRIGKLCIIYCFCLLVGGIFRYVCDFVIEYSKVGYDVGIVCDSMIGGVFEDKFFDQICFYLSFGFMCIFINCVISLLDFGVFMKSY